MTVRRLSLSFESALADRSRQAAEESGHGLSALVAEAIEYRLRLEQGRQLVVAWEAEHGPISEQELRRVGAKWSA